MNTPKRIEAARKVIAEFDRQKIPLHVHDMDMGGMFGGRGVLEIGRGPDGSRPDKTLTELELEYSEEIKALLLKEKRFTAPKYTDSNSVLSIRETSALSDLERVIETGMQSFLQVGEALWKIREGKLYRASHKTFEDYCRERWNIARSRAYELMSAHETAQSLPENVRHGGQNWSRNPAESRYHVERGSPLNERQLRELSKVEPSRREEVLTKASESGPVTAKSIREAAKPEGPEPQDTPHAKPSRLPRATVDSAKGIWLLAKAQLDKITKDDLSRTEVLLEVARYGLNGLPDKERKALIISESKQLPDEGPKDKGGAA